MNNYGHHGITILPNIFFLKKHLTQLTILLCSIFRQHKLYNKELYADFIAAQIKTLSFLAYIIRIYQVSYDRGVVVEYNIGSSLGTLQVNGSYSRIDPALPDCCCSVRILDGT